ncbi:hemerythrin domain-containing protein [Halalkalibacter alkalisediminis]|uniref:Hemerythrin domain-containing protein n=1 Tax=Halalkalibacter alkalisediminis TaxID=935616 RepID=A0ABV6NCS8_9BACI|nr:hemerythrin domain-containing protein [Halalkalibacter alkalisediminis]
MTQFCELAGNESVKLCPPLQRLKSEHVPLRAQMKNLYELSVSIEKEKEMGRMKDKLWQLRNGVIEFVTLLDPHSEKEEGVLFPMVANYIGKDVGPIYVMEYEHDQAKGNLRKFLEETIHVEKCLNSIVILEMAEFYNQAYHVLQGHFLKEEEILFPMAEKLLTSEEKIKLENQIGTI